MGKYDASGDGSFTQLNQLLETYGALPDYVKQADMDETRDPQGLVSSAYADQINRQFPCHTKAACYMSSMYFLGNVSQLPADDADLIAERLHKAAEAHGIVPDIINLVQRSSDNTKTAAAMPDDDASYALVKRSASLVERRYPLRNAKEVRAAAEWFNQYRDHFRFTERRQISERILDKAAEYGAMIPLELEYMLDKQAGRGVYEPKVAAEQLRRRALLPGVPQYLKESLDKLAEQVMDPLLAEDPTSTIKLAETMDQFDRNHNVKYSSLIVRPEDVLFAGSLKYASDFMAGSCPTMTGAIYDKQQFEKLSLLKIRDTLGEDIARNVQDGIGVDVEKLATIVTTLPLPDAVRFDQLMSQLGEGPAHKTATAVEITDEDRRAAAREYQGRELAAAH